jgi:hypothetical protein
MQNNFRETLNFSAAARLRRCFVDSIPPQKEQVPKPEAQHSKSYPRWTNHAKRHCLRARPH